MPIPPEVPLQTLTIPELEALLAAAETRLQKLREEERRAALAKLDQMAAGLGLSRSDLAAHFGKNGKAKKPARPAARFRNPSNPRQTWTGNGRRPAWVEEHLGGGGSLEELAI